MIITLGLVEVWYDNLNCIYMNGPPPRSAVADEPGRFRFCVLSCNDIVDSLERSYQLLKSFSKREIKIVVTVSPVPLKDTFTGEDVCVANMYSKSALRAAASQFCAAHNYIDYFPSYESIQMTEVLDLWEDDGRHVESKYVYQNVKRLLNCYCDELGIPEY